jgi:hypothetical protein
VPPASRDWQAEIDRWTDRFRDVEDPPEPFATALRDGWTPEGRRALAEEAEAYAARHDGYLRELRAAGVDLVRFDVRGGGCPECTRYGGRAYTLRGEHPDLPPPPPLPICPACRHTLNMLTPFFLQSMGLEMEDLVAESVPYAGPDATPDP